MKVGVLFHAIQLKDAIELKRQELHDIANKEQDLLHPAVLRVSKELDELIVVAQRKEGRAWATRMPLDNER